jgi:hypothetical protein
MNTRYSRYLACLLAAITALGTVPALAAPAGYVQPANAATRARRRRAI